MCTLSYLLTHKGYELFFNRDEQRTRPIALPPKVYKEAIYPVDPQGKGTWLAVNKHGLSLALLNFYQACTPVTEQNKYTIKSRGELIPRLMTTLANSEHNNSISALLSALDLSIYQPFQLAIFPKNLTKSTEKVYFYQWDGKKLILTKQQQPFTSSGVNFAYVEKQRKNKFKELVCPKNATREQFKSFHLSQENEGSYSVNMERFDAKTVSISHICVEQNRVSINRSPQALKLIQFDYFDNISQQQYSCSY
jgi:hypothetical protein